MIKNNVDCNNCRVKGCANYDNIRFVKNCTLYKKPEALQVPLLHHLMIGRKAKNTIAVLAMVGLVIQETDRYPNFKLNIQEGR